MPPIKITQKYIDAFIGGYNPLFTRFSFHPNPTDGWEKWENEQAKIYSTSDEWNEICSYILNAEKLRRMRKINKLYKLKNKKKYKNYIIDDNLVIPPIEIKKCKCGNCCKAKWKYKKQNESNVCTKCLYIKKYGVTSYKCPKCSHPIRLCLGNCGGIAMECRGCIGQETCEINYCALCI